MRAKVKQEGKKKNDAFDGNVENGIAVEKLRNSPSGAKQKKKIIKFSGKTMCDRLLCSVSVCIYGFEFI